MSPEKPTPSVARTRLAHWCSLLRHSLAGRRFYWWMAGVGLLSFFWHQYLMRMVELRDLYFLIDVAAYYRQGGLPYWGRELASTGFRTGSLEYLLMLAPLYLGCGLAGLLWLISFLWSACVVLTMAMLRKALSPATGLLAGFLLLNADPFLKYQLRFQNNTILPVFTTAALYFLLPALIDRRISRPRAAALGFASGAVVQIHPAAGLILLIGAGFWLARRVRTRFTDVVCYVGAALVPWIPFLIGEITSDFTNLRRLWASGLTDHIPLAESAWPRLLSWLQLFSSPVGIITLVILALVIVVFINDHRLRLSQRIKLTAVFCLVQIGLPLSLYDFPKKPLFLLFFEPTVAILAALMPWLLAAVLTAWGMAERKIHAARRAIFILLTVAALVLPVSRHFPLRGEFDLANAIGFRMGVAEKAAALGVPYQATWEDRFHGPFQLAERNCWDFIKTFHVAGYPDAGDNDVLIVPVGTAFASPLERRLILKGFQLIAIPRLVVDRHVTIDTRDELTLTASILPGGEHLYFQYAAKHISSPILDPVFQIDGEIAEPEEVHTYRDDIEAITVCRFLLPPAAAPHQLLIRIPRGARTVMMRVLDLFAVAAPVPFPPDGTIPTGN